ncbi:hypothetical protein MHH70_05970 [Metasolibacillus sp. FSL H7-0170]|uniref:hypothetical protein n=1 Tax=Metasolibacillus sp. FSL H7-0170 TaxID=2921431 RepID=UPI0031593841
MKNEREAGLTLVEILAAIILISIISIILMTIFSRSSDIYQKQSSTNMEINDAAYALKVLTKEIRKTTEPDSVKTPSETELFIGILHYTFDETNNQITENGIPKFTNIQNFYANREEDIVKIKIMNEHGKDFVAELSIRK